MLGGRDRPKAGAAFGAEILGRRSEQQDTFRIRQFEEGSACLIVLSDGMGGHACGALASRIAADGFLSSFLAQRSKDAPLDEAFPLALREANDRIARARDAAPEIETMGTTLVAAYLSAEGVSWISVGDSPLWLFRDGRLIRLNEDHSLRNYARGGNGGAANMLCSALDGEATALIDIHAEPQPTIENDLVVAASDGILTLTEEEIAAHIVANRGAGVEATTKAVLAAVAAADSASQDNCTLVIASPLASGRGSTPPRTRAALPTMLASAVVRIFRGARRREG